jgi:chromosome segregation ATPase
MAEVTNELPYELMKRFHERFDKLDHGISEEKQELISIRGPMLSMQNDVHNIYAKLDRHEQQLERIEHRLELRELAEPHTPFGHDR